MKFKWWYLVLIPIACIMIWSSYQKAAGYVLGTVRICEKVNFFPNYIGQLKKSRDNIKKMSWEEYRDERQKELQYEFNFFDYLGRYYRKLEENNMIGE